MITAHVYARKTVKADAMRTDRANAQHLAQMAAMRQAKRAAQTTAKADAIQAAGVCAPRRPTESPVPMAAMQRDVLAVT